MTISKLFPSGAIEVSDIVNGYLVRRVYYGYSKRAAVSFFRSEFYKVKSWKSNYH